MKNKDCKCKPCTCGKEVICKCADKVTKLKEKLKQLKNNMPKRPGLYANMNRRKKLGISRPKSKSTVSDKAYANMKAGFPKKY